MTHERPSLWWRTWWQLRGSLARRELFLAMAKNTSCHSENFLVRQTNKMRELLRMGLGRQPCYYGDLDFTLEQLIDHNGRLDSVQMLLQAGADPNAYEKNNYYDSPLTRAARKWRTDLFPVLLARGADATWHDSCEQTVWHLVVDVLCDRPMEHRFPTTTQRRMVEGLNVLFQYANPLQPGGREPYWWRALEVHRLDILQQFIDAGADITQASSDGTSPLEAVINRHAISPCEEDLATQASLCQILVDKGIAVADTTRHSCSLGLLAIHNDNLDRLQWLCEQGWSLDGLHKHPNKHDHPTTVLHYLAWHTHPDSAVAKWVLPRLGPHCWEQTDGQGISVQQYIKRLMAEAAPNSFAQDNARRWMVLMEQRRIQESMPDNHETPRKMRARL